MGQSKPIRKGQWSHPKGSATHTTKDGRGEVEQRPSGFMARLDGKPLCVKPNLREAKAEVERAARA